MTLVILCVKMDKISILTDFDQFRLIFDTFGLILRTRSRFFQYFSLNVFCSPFLAKVIKFMHILSIEIGSLFNLATILTILIIFCRKTPQMPKISPKNGYRIFFIYLCLKYNEKVKKSLSSHFAAK